MSSHDYVIANDTGANVRADLNLALLAIQSQNSGSSEPSTTYAYQFWADTSGTPTLKQRNAANNAWINILTLSTGAPSATELSGDSTPQLGGQLDVNGNAIGDGTLELLKFSETGSAVNEFTIANAATTNGPTLSATGGDANVDINISAKGSGVVAVSSTMNPSLTSTGKALVMGF